jgi:2-oxoglutarate dehydrogenase E2 component (dihydrolipoamide succinyltransferase)
MPHELKIPRLGESISQVELGQWHKAEGERVEKDEPLVELETDKATVELPSPASGVLGRILKRKGESAAVGEVVGSVQEAAAEAAAGPAGRAETAPAAGSPAETVRAEPPAAAPSAAPAVPPGSEGPAAPAPRPPAVARPSVRRPAGGGDDDEPWRPEPRVMPAAKRLLSEHGLAARDVRATGPGGRLLKEDVLRKVAPPDAEEPVGFPEPSTPQPARASLAPAAPHPAAAPAASVAARPAPAASSGPDRPAASQPPHPPGGPGEEVVPMTPIRRRIAERLVSAQHTAALLTTFNEVDMSAVQALRRQHQEAFTQRHGVKLGLMSFFVKASIEALKLVPQMNAEVRGTDIVYRRFYDIGVAVGGGRGLVVPVLRGADAMGFGDLERTIAELAARATTGKLMPDELAGGTFTISNGGIYGSLLSTPIVNPPQSGILGLHAIQDRPVARDGAVVIRPMMYLALTYDHRIVDGREAVTFLKRIKECVEEPARMLIDA